VLAARVSEMALPYSAISHRRRRGLWRDGGIGGGEFAFRNLAIWKNPASFLVRAFVANGSFDRSGG
jgi:hypothetical protein